MPTDDAEGMHPREGLADPSEVLSPEERERELAWRRGQQRLVGLHDGRAEEAWREASAIAARAFIALAENVRDYAIFLMDPEGMITFWGEGAHFIKWWTKEEAEGAHLRLLYPPGGSEDGTAEEHLVQAAMHGEYTGEGNRIRSDGSTFWAGVTLTALWDADGTLLGYAKVTRDVTARRAADALLQSASAAAEEARSAAEAANIAKSGFLATMSHEVRTPVNAIMGYLDLLSLEIGGTLTTEQRSYVERAARGSRHLLALVTEVLDFSRIEAHRAPIARRAFRVGDVVSHALSLVAPQASQREIEISDDVSGFAGGLAAWGDEVRVRQIITNLLVNAVKFTDVGRITVSAGTATEPPPDAKLTGAGPWVFIRVEDTGPGIATDQIERIFEPFVQADMTLTRAHGGTGLGLAISRELARAMSGEVVARSEVGIGSTFILWLPAAPVETLETGGIEGHVTGNDATNGGPSAIELVHMGKDALVPGGSLRVMAEVLLTELERLLGSFSTRVREDPEIPSAKALLDSEIEDHFGSFLADLAGTLSSLDTKMDTPADALGDGTAIQRVIAERHGWQRARLGWAEAEVRREFRILREELGAALKRRAPRELLGPTNESRVREVTRTMELLDQFLHVAEGVSLDAFRRTTRL